MWVLKEKGDCDIMKDYVLLYVIVGLMLFILTMSFGTAGRIGREGGEVSIVPASIPKCPYCGSTEFPPYSDPGEIWDTGWPIPGVYLCEDCGKVWGSKAEEWLVLHPDPLFLVSDDLRGQFLRIQGE